jgi:phosphoglycolate phosphatase-like HAD superfamily hydrolase
MPETAGRGLVFLDFDGVVCDSLPECFAVSRAAYYGLYLGGAVPEAGVDDERDFRSLRPFIRRGGDYLFIQMALHRGKRIGSQEEFDAIVRESPCLDDTFHELFYQARRELLASDPDRWYALNPLYPGMAGLLLRRGGDPDVLILSTKEADFIGKILAFNGIPWEAGRILCSGKERKLLYIDRVMDELGADRAVFIDDQLDHFKGGSAHPVQCLLADWGYVLPGWLSGGAAGTVSLAGLETAIA